MSSSTPKNRSLSLVLICCALCCSCNDRIERMKNCGKRDYCKGRSSRLLQPPHLMDQNDLRAVQCFCDENCSKHGDCCVDAASPANNTTGRKLECVHVSYNQSIYAIADCKSGNDSLVGACRKTVTDESYHYSLDIPVHSNLTGRSYANIYCALCNHELKSNIKSMRLTVECNNTNVTLEQLKKKFKYLKGELRWELDGNVCLLQPDEKSIMGRKCVVSKSTCPSTTNTDISTKCTGYSQTVAYKTSENHLQLFKNPHCALCNGINATKLRCWYGFRLRTMPSLTIIFDFDFDFTNCHLPHSVWDGLHGRCTNTMCDARIEACEVEECNETTALCTRHYSDLTLNIEGYLTTICLSSSIFCLLLHMFLSFFLPHSKNLPGKILNSLSFSLAIAQALFLCFITPLFEVPDDICFIFAVLIQFFFLLSFFWMNVMSIDISRTFSNESFKGQSSKSHSKYAAYAWGGAGFVTTVSVTADITDFLPKHYRPYYAASDGLCWFANKTALAIFFFFPICFILLLNIIMFGITVCWFQKQHSQSEVMKSSGRKEYTRLWLYIKLFVIMGLTWGCGMVAALANKFVFRYPFIVFNGLQGTFLFIMFDLKTEVLMQILKKFGITNFINKTSKQKQSDGTQSSKLSSPKFTRAN